MILRTKLVVLANSVNDLIDNICESDVLGRIANEFYMGTDIKPFEF